MLYRETYEGFYPADPAGAYPVLGGDYSLATNDYYSFKHKQETETELIMSVIRDALCLRQTAAADTPPSPAPPLPVRRLRAIRLSCSPARRQDEPEAINAVKNFTYTVTAGRPIPIAPTTSTASTTWRTCRTASRKRLSTP